MKFFSFLFLVLFVNTQCTTEKTDSNTDKNDTLTQVEIGSISRKVEYSKLLNKLDLIHQECLDEGIEMLNCSKKYYSEMDSILNDVYRKLMKNKDIKEKNILKKEQLDWLKERDRVFIEFDNEKISELSAYENQTFSLTKKAEFVKERIEILITKFSN